MGILYFENFQPFLKYHARKIKFRRFTCIKIGNERFAPENCDYFSIYNVFETKNISMNSIQSAEFDKFKSFRKIFQNLPKTGKIAEVFFLRRTFHLMCQSELKVRANAQF